MRKTVVAFKSRALENTFIASERGKMEDKLLHKNIVRIIDELKRDPCCGVRIARRLWPSVYVSIDNLWKKDMPGGFRLFYTIKSDQTMTVSIILEWLDHKRYERRFGY